jgi:two-component system, OmpR family, sensor kinase
MRPFSLRARLTVWYTLALFVVLCLFGADVLWQQGRLGIRRVDRELDVVIVTFANVVRDELTENTDVVAAVQEARSTVAAPGRAVAILDPGGVVLAANWNGLALQDPASVARGGARSWTIDDPSGAWRVLARPYTFDTRTFVLVAASPLANVYRERHEVQEAMVIGIPIVMLLAAAGGLWLSSIGLRPITAMAHRASRIPLTGLEDLGESNRTDELGQLANAFNGLVARLRAALQTQRQFMADASHELRTPVSVIRSAADVTLSREQRDDGEYREALGIVGVEARRLGTLVEDMLVLARADAGGYPLRPVSLYLDEVVDECRRAAEVLATARSVCLRVVGLPETAFRGDEDLLRRMVLNLLQNGVEHTSPGGTVTVDMSTSSALEIRIVDQGSGIPESDRRRIFDRFVQLDPARRGHGTGLGLPIARWIAEAHGGTLELESSGPGGSTFCISLPLESDVARGFSRA